MDKNEMNINEEILENVSGGLPTGPDGKSVTPSEFRKLVGKDRKNISDEILEGVSGGRPVGKNGKPLTPSEFRKLVGKSRIHVTSASFGPEDDDNIDITTETY